MKVVILHTTLMPGNPLFSLQKYPRFENKFRSPEGSKLVPETLQYVRIYLGHD